MRQIRMIRIRASRAFSGRSDRQGLPKPSAEVYTDAEFLLAFRREIEASAMPHDLNITRFWYDSPDVPVEVLRCERDDARQSARMWHSATEAWIRRCREQQRRAEWWKWSALAIAGMFGIALLGYLGALGVL